MRLVRRIQMLFGWQIGRDEIRTSNEFSTSNLVRPRVTCCKYIGFSLYNLVTRVIKQQNHQSKSATYSTQLAIRDRNDSLQVCLL